jgi:hypothetical protein
LADGVTCVATSNIATSINRRACPERALGMGVVMSTSCKGG